MSAADVRPCYRCSRDLPSTPLDPIHACPHGTPCNVNELQGCPICFAEWQRREERTGPRRVHLEAIVRASLTMEPLKALGGTATSGVAAGPAGIVRGGR